MIRFRAQHKQTSQWVEALTGNQLPDAVKRMLNDFMSDASCDLRQAYFDDYYDHVFRCRRGSGNSWFGRAIGKSLHIGVYQQDNRRRTSSVGVAAVARQTQHCVAAASVLDHRARRQCVWSRRDKLADRTCRHFSQSRWPFGPGGACECMQHAFDSFKRVQRGAPFG